MLRNTTGTNVLWGEATCRQCRAVLWISEVCGGEPVWHIIASFIVFSVKKPSETGGGGLLSCQAITNWDPSGRGDLESWCDHKESICMCSTGFCNCGWSYEMMCTCAIAFVLPGHCDSRTMAREVNADAGILSLDGLNLKKGESTAIANNTGSRLVLELVASGNWILLGIFHGKYWKCVLALSSGKMLKLPVMWYKPFTAALIWAKLLGVLFLSPGATVCRIPPSPF